MVLTIYMKSKMFVKIFTQETNHFRMIQGDTFKLVPPLGGIQKKVLSVGRITKVKVDLGMAHDEHEKGVSDIAERR